MKKTIRLYGSIEKQELQEDGTIIVSGFASSETVDSQGEVITAKAMNEALPDYMKFANIREMHQPKAAGVALEAQVQDDGRTWIKTHIVDGEAVKKIQAKVYKGFSVGGRVTGRDEKNSAVITGIKLSEISLVDRPANPEAVFSMGKVDIEEAKVEESEAEKSTEVASQSKLQKGMWAVSYLASILSSIQDLQGCTEWEAEVEGDGSAMPAELKEWLKQGGTLLVSMVEEETAELTEEVTAADKSKDLEKAGARHSKADMEKLQGIHDHSVAMGAKCAKDDEAAMADKPTDINKVAALEETLKKMQEDNTALEKRVKELEALPAATTTVLKSDAKADDIQIEKAEDEPKDAISAIRKAHMSPIRIM